MTGRGRLKIYLGMAAGVGKTYRMLQEGQAEWESGRDVAIGLLETHGRVETLRLAEGLPVIPRRRVVHRDTELDELDLPAILRAAPELCLIDELAHTNPPGLEHAKRCEDVETVIAAGIDVISTLNVQHLESLNDRIAELSGVRVRETIPDAVLARADEVVLVDLNPEALLDRLRAGKIYPEGRIDAALNNFFRIENLAALREIALRQVAQEVEAKRTVREVVGSRDGVATQVVGERLMALVEPYPGAQRLVRRAFRSAQRLGADLDLLWIAPPGGRMDDEQRRALDALRELASVLGARLIVEESDQVPDAVAEVARRVGTTYVLMGKPRAGARRRAGCAGRSPWRSWSGSRASTCGSSPDRARRQHGRWVVSALVTVAIALVAATAGVALGVLGIRAAAWRPRRADEHPRPVHRILLPVTGQALSRRAFEAAIRLAKAEDATIMPAFLARVPMNLPIGAAVPRQAAIGMPLLEAIEQGARMQGVRVDARVGRGRTYRDALRHLLEEEHFDRVIVSAGDASQPGLGGDDVRWLLERAPAEVLILRPAPEDTRRITGAGIAGHF